MSYPPPDLEAFDRAAEALAEAATSLTMAMVAAGHTRLGNDAYILAEAVEAELAAVTTARLRHTNS